MGAAVRVALAILALVACGSEFPVAQNAPTQMVAARGSAKAVATVTVAPAGGGDTMKLELRDTSRAIATPRNKHGVAVTTSCTWVSSTPAVATVHPLTNTQQADVRAASSGSTTVTATCGGKQGRLPVLIGTAVPPDTTTTPPDTTTPPTPGVVSCVTGCRWVGPEGNDLNAGTEAAPYRTIQKAASVTVAGDSVLVKPGVYTGGSTIVSITRAGTAAAWVTFVCVTDRACKVDGQSNTSVEGFNIKASYTEVSGFEIFGLQGYGFVIYSSGTHHFRVTRNWTHDIGRYCFTGTNGRTGVSIGSGTHNAVFTLNKWGPGIGRFNDVEDPNCYGTSTVYRNHDHGIYVADTDSVTIQRDTFIDHKRGWAIQRYKSGGYTTKHLKILDNVFSGANPYRDGHIILATATTGLSINRNHSIRPTRAFITVSSGTSLSGEVRDNRIEGAVTLVGSSTGLTMSGNVEVP